jgi:hypothetical protein
LYPLISGATTKYPSYSNFRN